MPVHFYRKELSTNVHILPPSPLKGVTVRFWNLEF